MNIVLPTVQNTANPTKGDGPRSCLLVWQLIYGKRFSKHETGISLSTCLCISRTVAQTLQFNLMIAFNCESCQLSNIVLEILCHSELWILRRQRVWSLAADLCLSSCRGCERIAFCRHSLCTADEDYNPYFWDLRFEQTSKSYFRIGVHIPHHDHSKQRTTVTIADVCSWLLVGHWVSWWAEHRVRHLSGAMSGCPLRDEKKGHEETISVTVFEDLQKTQS